MVAIAAVYAFWWLPVAIRPWNDFAFVYAAGRSWLKGLSPYDYPRWEAEWAAIRPPETVVSQPMPFMYPPYWGPIAAALALSPWRGAARLWDLFNLLGFAGTCWFAVELAGLDAREQLRKPALWLFLAFTMLNPALRYSIFQSQMTIVASFGLAGAFWAWQRKKAVWLGVFAFVAALKPQLSALPLLYLFLNGGHLAVGVAGLAAVGVGVLSMIPSDLALFPAQLRHCYALHMQLEFNRADDFDNLPALAAGRASPHVLLVLGPGLALAGVAVLTWLRRRSDGVLQDPLWQAALVLALTGALMPLHGYDLVMYTPLFFLAYRLRASWMGLVIPAMVIATGRARPLNALLQIRNATPLLTLALAAVVAVAALRTRSPQPLS